MKWYYMDIYWIDDHIQDAIMGTNEEDAVESAYKNWPEAINIELTKGMNDDEVE